MKEVVTFRIADKVKCFEVWEVPTETKEQQQIQPELVCVVNAKTFKPVFISDMENIDKVDLLRKKLKRMYKNRI